jgi:toxin ParE1/3/4
MPYRTTNRADQDIVGLYAHSARSFGRSHADLYFADLVHCFDLLAGQPQLARERREFTPPVRIHFHKAHAIIYLIRDDGILIVRVLDSRQDWASYLLE